MSRQRRAIPEASAAAKVTAARRTSSAVRPGTGATPARSTSTEPNRRLRSSPITGAVVTPSAGATNHSSAALLSSRWVAEGRSQTASWLRPRPITAPAPIAFATSGVAPSNEAAITGPSSGPGTSSEAQASIATAWSSTDPPPPPTASGRPMVATPISATAFQVSANVASASSSVARATSAPPSDAAHLRRLAPSSTCSSVIPIDICCLSRWPVRTSSNGSARN